MGCFGLQLSWAQQKSISGTVFDETGGPLPGATIIVEGSSRGVATDFDGNFSIEVSEGETLLVTYVGYADQRITIGTADSYSSHNNSLKKWARDGNLPYCFPGCFMLLYSKEFYAQHQKDLRH